MTLACDQAPAPLRERHAELLERIAAGELDVPCATLGDPTLAADCTWAAVSAGAPPERCAELTDLAADECWFLAAEEHRDVRYCASAGRFERDCRMHQLSQGLRTLSDDWQQAEREASDRIVAVGLGDDANAWHAVYRGLLSRLEPLALGPCRSARAPEACVEAGTGLFHDKLNRFRDLGADLCEGPLPDDVTYTPSAELDAVLAQRRATDLCSGVRNAPPPGAE